MPSYKPNLQRRLERAQLTHACHICTRTGLAPATSAPGLGWAHSCHICTRTGRTIALERAQLAPFEVACRRVRQHDVDSEQRAAVEVGRVRQRPTGLDHMVLDAAHGELRAADALEESGPILLLRVRRTHRAQQLL